MQFTHYTVCGTPKYPLHSIQCTRLTTLKQYIWGVTPEPEYVDAGSSFSPGGTGSVAHCFTMGPSAVKEIYIDIQFTSKTMTRSWKWVFWLESPWVNYNQGAPPKLKKICTSALTSNINQISYKLQTILGIHKDHFLLYYHKRAKEPTNQSVVIERFNKNHQEVLIPMLFTKKYHQDLPQK